MTFKNTLVIYRTTEQVYARISIFLTLATPFIVECETALPTETTITIISPKRGWPIWELRYSVTPTRMLILTPNRVIRTRQNFVTILTELWALIASICRVTLQVCNLFAFIFTIFALFYNQIFNMFHVRILRK